MRHIILGASGFIGQYLSEYLTTRGSEIVSIDIKIDRSHDLRYLHLDLLSTDRIYFLAWDVGGAKYLYNPSTQKQQLEWNIALLSNVMPQLASHKFIFISSRLVDGVSVYATTKRLGELWTALYSGTTVRLWNVYGRIEPMSERSHVVSDFIWQALLNNHINMLSDGSELRDLIHLDDVCRAITQAVELSGGVYRVKSDEPVSMFKLASLIADNIGCGITKGQIINESDTSPSTLEAVPGWHCNTTLSSGIISLIDKFRSKLATSNTKSADISTGV